MNMKKRLLTILIVRSLFALALPVLADWGQIQPVLAATPAYFVEDLGALPGDTASVAWGINQAGQVVGWSLGPNGTRAFLYTDGVGMVSLPGLPNRPRSYARRINDFGQVVGTANSGGTDIGHAVRWDADGTIHDLGTLGTGSFSEALGINIAGQVAGYSYINGGSLPYHAFIYADKGMLDITPDADSGYASEINDNGQVAGYQNNRAFRWENGVLRYLSAATNSFAFAINNGGQVAGTLASADGNVERIFRFTDAVGLVDLGGVGEHNRAYGINSSGDLVGTGRPSGGLKRAFLYTDAQGLQDLRQLIATPLQWFLLGAFDINDPGQIVGYASNNFTQQTHAVRLRPASMGCTSKCLRSTAIKLSARVRQDTRIVHGKVTVRNKNGTAIQGATVSATWVMPNSRFRNQTATTDSKGIASFSVKNGLGTYALVVTDIRKVGYSFDPFHGVLSKSITP